MAKSAARFLRIFFGLAHDGLTEFLQNDYSHRKNDVAPVPRDGERRGLLWGGSLEANRTFAQGWLLAGAGGSANSVYHAAYFHAGLPLHRQPVFSDKWGIKYAAISRVDVLRPSRERLFAGQRYFHDLSPVVAVAQGEIGLFAKVYGIPLEFSWRGGYSSGVFRNADHNEAEGMWLEGLKTVVWRFSFERYNDALNGTDYGPTYGVKLNLDVGASI